MVWENGRVTYGLLAAVFAQVGLEDGVGFDDVFWFSAGALSVIAVLTIVFRKPLRELGSFIRWSKQFMEDWSGTPERDGRGATPGVMQRLDRLDGELRRNGGETTKDKAAKAFEVATRVESKIDMIALALEAETKAREAWDAQYREDQDRIRDEWIQVFLGVGQMIHMTPEEQERLWSGLTSRYTSNTLVPTNPE